MTKKELEDKVLHLETIVCEHENKIMFLRRKLQTTYDAVSKLIDNMDSGDEWKRGNQDDNEDD